MNTMDLVLRRTGQLGMPTLDFSSFSNTSSPSSSGTWGRIDNYVNQGVSLLSQWLAGKGDRPTTQIVSSGGLIQPVYSQQQQQQPQYYQVPQGQSPGYANSPGSAVGSGLDGILNFVMTPVGLLVVGGVVLLFMRPPGRR